MPTTRSWTNRYNRNSSTRNTRTGAWGRSNFSGSGHYTSATWPCNSPKFSAVRDECQTKIGSFRTIYAQCTGAGKTCFSPSTANKWTRFVNNGACVYQFSGAQFTKTFGRQFNHATPTTAFRMMKRKYGAGIKAVTQGRNNTWLVCASSSITARPFSNYNWK